MEPMTTVPNPWLQVCIILFWVGRRVGSKFWREGKRARSNKREGSHHMCRWEMSGCPTGTSAILSLCSEMGNMEANFTEDRVQWSSSN